MNCGHAMDLVLGADRDGRVPLRARAHFLFCPRCAAEARRLQAALDCAGNFLPESPDFAPSVAAALANDAPEPCGAPVSLFKWLSVGALILTAMVLSPLGEDYGWARAFFGAGFLLPLNLVLGSTLAVYCALFIGTHLAQLSALLKLRGQEKRV